MFKWGDKMKKITYRHSLDVKKHGVQFTINAFENDANTRELMLSLLNGSVPLELDMTAGANLYCIKPDKTVVYEGSHIVNNTVIITLSQQTLAAVGTVNCQLRLISTDENGDGQVISCPEFEICVHKSNFDDSALQSADEFSGMVEATAQMIEAKNSAVLAAQNAKDIANSLIASKENGEFNGADGRDGLNGLNGKDGIDGKDGTDGVSITDSAVNDNGELLLTYSDGQIKNVGRVVGVKGDKGDKGEAAQLPENLRRTVVVYSDEEAEQRLAEIAENFSNLAPIEILFAYDALDSQGFPAGTSALIIDNGSGNIEDAIIVPFISCETVFTSEQAQQLSECNSFVSAYYSDTDWFPIDDYSSTSFTINRYVASYNSSLSDHKTRHLMFDLKFSGFSCFIDVNSTYNARITLSRSDYEGYVDEDGYVSLHIDIQPCGSHWLAEITAPNGTKTLERTSQTGGRFIASVHFLHADMITVTNAYGRSI